MELTSYKFINNINVIISRILDTRSHNSVFPYSRSSTKHPRTCGPGERRWSVISALVQPASSKASARAARWAG